jgi:hypothetical protein
VKSVFDFLWPIVLGAIGWITLEFVARPIRNFFDVRREVGQQLVQFANVSARWKSRHLEPEVREAGDLSEEEAGRLEAAQRTYRDLGARMKAFGETEHPATWLLKHAFRIDAVKARSAMLGLSNSVDSYGDNRAHYREAVRKALRIKHR